MTVWLEMEDGGKCAVICEKNGKQLKSVPAKIKKDEYVLALMDAKKQMAEQSRRTKAMLEDAMESQEEYTWAERSGACWRILLYMTWWLRWCSRWRSRMV